MKHSITKLCHAAEETGVALGSRKSVHVIVTSTEPDNSSENEESTTVHPLFSNIILAALEVSNPRSSIASQAIFDMFLV